MVASGNRLPSHVSRLRALLGQPLSGAFRTEIPSGQWCRPVLGATGRVTSVLRPRIARVRIVSPGNGFWDVVTSSDPITLPSQWTNNGVSDLRKWVSESPVIRAFSLRLVIGNPIRNLIDFADGSDHAGGIAGTGRAAVACQGRPSFGDLRTLVALPLRGRRQRDAQPGDRGVDRRRSAGRRGRCGVRAERHVRVYPARAGPLGRVGRPGAPPGPPAQAVRAAGGPGAELGRSGPQPAEHRRAARGGPVGDQRAARPARPPADAAAAARARTRRAHRAQHPGRAGEHRRAGRH